MRGNTPAVGRDSVGPLFSRSPPCALLLGMERRFDEIPLLEAARSIAAYRPVIAESDLVFAVREDLLPQR
jgi:fibrillarin-like rRNA methylase